MMMKKLTIALISIAFWSCSKDTMKQVVKTRETRETIVATYSGNQITTYFNRNRTSNEIGSLIKTQITTDIQKSEDKKSITVNMSAPDDNPLSKYFKNKSKLQLKNQFLPHNIIPSIDPATVTDVIYIDSTSKELSYLKVVTN